MGCVSLVSLVPGIFSPLGCRFCQREATWFSLSARNLLQEWGQKRCYFKPWVSVALFCRPPCKTLKPTNTAIRKERQNSPTCVTESSKAGHKLAKWGCSWPPKTQSRPNASCQKKDLASLGSESYFSDTKDYGLYWMARLKHRTSCNFFPCSFFGLSMGNSLPSHESLPAGR